MFPFLLMRYRENRQFYLIDGPPTISPTAAFAGRKQSLLSTKILGTSSMINGAARPDGRIHVAPALTNHSG